MKTYALLALAALAGCAVAPGWPGYISETKAEFDGATIISVHPGAASGCCSLGATWNSKRLDEVQIVAAVSGYTSIDSAKGLQFNVDGQVIEVDAAPYPTQLETVRALGNTYRSSSKTFVMRRADFDRLLTAKMLKVRLHTASGFSDGDLMRDAYPGSAIEGFRSFAKRLQ
jgi:hypothetical protein